MKKYQLLEKAMRDYPAGTIARFTSAPYVDHISDGIFKILDINNDGSTGVYSGQGLNCFYISHEDGEYNPEWAVPEKKSILSGKCAIQVNNEREFKLLMSHYAEKGWNPCPIQTDKTDYGTTHHIIEYCNPFLRMDESNIIATRQYTIIPFADFAAETGITVPVKIGRKTEDGKDIYIGDSVYCCYKEWASGGNNGKWYLEEEIRPITGNVEYIFMQSGRSDDSKAFSTKEAAEKWCAEQHKPKEACVKLTNEGYQALVSKGTVFIAIPNEPKYVVLYPSDIDLISEAYKSLQ